MRIKNTEERLGDFGELVVDLQMDARRKKRKRLQQPFDVRVFALIGLHNEARRDLRILVRKLRPHLAQEVEFAFVVEQQIVTHCAHPGSDTRRLSAAGPCRTKSVQARGPSAAGPRSETAMTVRKGQAIRPA